MKMILCVPVLVVVWLYGCALLPGKDEVKDFIPGVYVRHYTDEFTDSYDTITLQPITAGGSGGYRVTKRSRFEKLNEYGKKIPGYEFKHWTGTYDDKSRTIWLQDPGKRIYFDPAKGELKLGSEPYKKM